METRIPKCRVNQNIIFRKLLILLFGLYDNIIICRFAYKFSSNLNEESQLVEHLCKSSLKLFYLKIVSNMCKRMKNINNRGLATLNVGPNHRFYFLSFCYEVVFHIRSNHVKNQSYCPKRYPIQ